MTPPAVIEPDEFWAEILSGEQARVRKAVEQLPPAELAGVRAHLQVMAEGAGWSLGQQRRARAALEVMLGSQPD
ncbi:MAG: hypothetical protein WD906_05965 [Anaerolineales bacterium]